MEIERQKRKQVCGGVPFFYMTFSILKKMFQSFAFPNTCLFYQMCLQHIQTGLIFWRAEVIIMQT